MAASTSPPSPNHYRPEIDGLRALSVAIVVLFHAGFGFPGGYIGVDVFFVISGYLITGIIVRGLEDQQFSLAEFYCRRIRRIFPAACLVVAIILFAGFRSLLADDFEQVAKASIFQSFFAANYFYWQEAGYFSRDVATKPLLHTWSLAVEEQFYLFYPTLIVLLFQWRQYSRAKVLAVISLIGAGSFALNLYGIVHHPSFTFYALPTRAWELMAGAAFAISTCAIHKRWLSEILAWAGIGTIIAASLLLTETTAFPGLWALLPVGGGVAFIAANTNRLTSAGRIFACRPIVFLGLISYSLYLWHWPLLAFLRYFVKEPSRPMFAAAVSISVLLSVLSWWLVEQPIRRKLVLRTNRSLLIVALVVWGLTLGASIIVVRTGGLPGRFDKSQAALIEDATWTGKEYVRTIEELEQLGPTPLGKKEPGITEGGFLLWGDSHAATLTHMMDRLAVGSGVHGFVAIRGGTPPIPGLWHAGMPRSQEFNDAVMRFIERQKITDVILVSRWAVYVTGFSPWDPMFDGRKDEDLYLSDSEQGSTSGTESLSAMQRKLIDQIVELKRIGVRVWLLKQVPSQRSLVAENAVRNMLLGSDVNAIRPTTRTLHQEHQRAVSGLYKAVADLLQQTGGAILDPADALFDDSDKALLRANDRFTYRDDDHLSKSGAELLAPLLRATIGGAK